MSYSLLETGEGEGEVRMQGREDVKCQCVRVHVSVQV